MSVVGFSMGGGIALQLAMEHPERVARLVVAGVGDPALDELADQVTLAEIRRALADPSAPAAGVAATIRRNASLGGRDPRVLLPFLSGRGWRGGLDQLHPLAVPTLLVLASRDEYMQPAEAIVERLRPTRVLNVDAGHHDVLLQPAVQREAVLFLRT